MGAPDVAASLHQVDGRKIDEHPVGSTILQSSDSAQDCHILYLGDGTVLDTGPLKGVLRGVLVVSDRPGVGAIRFVNMDQRLRFSVDLHQTHAADISLSADVLSLAIAVEGRTKE